MSDVVIVVWIFLLILVVVTLFAGVKTVSQGQVWTVERFGAYTRLLQPGLNFVLPYVDRVGRKLNVQEQVVEIPEQSVITRDNASVSVDGIIYYRVMEPGDGGVSGHQPDARADHAGNDQHPCGDRRDGTGRHAVVA